jgi:tRNA-Thr(GGU) m(6)t(6)A37 methyltransferase TsaA
MAQEKTAAARIQFRPIGIIRSPHEVAEETPIQPAFARGATGRAEIFPEFEEGLNDLDGFSHIYLIYHLHMAGSARLTVTPFLDDVPRGVFATRAPRRPNPIGLSVVRLLRREGAILHLDELDVLDGTPLLDIKPYAPRFDPQAKVRTGWLESVDEAEARRRGRRKWQGHRGADR